MWPCSAYQAVPSGQVHQAHAEARAEVEAAAKQRLAALDQARREEREAAARAALALGIRRVGARPAPDTGARTAQWAGQQAVLA